MISLIFIRGYNLNHQLYSFSYVSFSRCFTYIVCMLMNDSSRKTWYLAQGQQEKGILVTFQFTGHTNLLSLSAVAPHLIIQVHESKAPTSRYFLTFSNFSLINQLTTRELMSIITDNYRLKSQLLFYYILVLYHDLHSIHIIKIGHAPTQFHSQHFFKYIISKAFAYI